MIVTVSIVMGFVSILIMAIAMTKRYSTKIVWSTGGISFMAGAMIPTAVILAAVADSSTLSAAIIAVIDNYEDFYLGAAAYTFGSLMAVCAAETGKRDSGFKKYARAHIILIGTGIVLLW